MHVPCDGLHPIMPSIKLEKKSGSKLKKKHSCSFVLLESANGMKDMRNPLPLLRRNDLASVFYRSKLYALVGTANLYACQTVGCVMLSNMLDSCVGVIFVV